jgi:hypothetical protein
MPNALGNVEGSKSSRVVIFDAQGKLVYASASTDWLTIRYKRDLLELPYVFREEKPDLVLVEADWKLQTCERMVAIVKRQEVATCPVMLFSDKRTDEDLKHLARGAMADGILERKDALPALFPLWVRTILSKSRVA